MGLSHGRQGHFSVHAGAGAVPAAPCPRAVCAPGEALGEAFLASPCRRAPRLLPRLSTASSASPKAQLIASQRPLSAIPAANVPHFPLIHGELQRGAGAAHPSLPPPRPPGPAAPPEPTGTAHPHGTYGSHEKTIPQPANPKLQGGDRLCDQTGMAEETPPPQMPYLFAALASRVSGGGSPVLLLPDPELGRHRSSLSLPPLF